MDVRGHGLAGFEFGFAVRAAAGGANRWRTVAAGGIVGAAVAKPTAAQINAMYVVALDTALRAIRVAVTEIDLELAGDAFAYNFDSSWFDTASESHIAGSGRSG